MSAPASPEVGRVLPVGSRASRLLTAYAGPLGLALLGMAVRLPFLGRPLTSDEGGYLMVAGQWSPGSSLYGDYWVDRPPLLVAIFSLADRLGGSGDGRVALRVLTAALVGLSVVLAGAVGHALAEPALRRRAASWTAGTAVLLLSSPLFGAVQADGEILATPFVIAGVLCVVRASRSPGGVPVRAWLVGAGASGAAAALVKQNMLGVLVVVVLALLAHRTSTRLRARALAWAALGAGTTVVAVLLAAAARATPPGALWDALVAFRLDALPVLGHVAGDGTTASAAASSTAASDDRPRLLWTVLALLGSGAPVLPALVGARWRHLPEPLARWRWPTAGLLAWGALSIGLGGSWWLHYLVCLVPGLVLCTALLTAGRPTGQVRGTRLLPAAGTYAALAAGVALVVAWPVRGEAARDERVVAWLAAHQRAGDTAVVVLGHPNILRETGMDSPYPQLWSLPVRVLDPDLGDLTDLLTSGPRPTWVVTLDRVPGGTSVSGPAAAAALAKRFHLAATVPGARVWRVDGRTP